MQTEVLTWGHLPTVMLSPARFESSSTEKTSSTSPGAESIESVEGSGSNEHPTEVEEQESRPSASLDLSLISITNMTEEEVLVLAESLFRERAGADLSLSIPSSVSFVDEVLLLLRVDGRCLRSSSRLYMRNSIVSTITTDLRLDRVGWSTLRQLLFSITRRITTMRSLFE